MPKLWNFLTERIQIYPSSDVDYIRKEQQAIDLWNGESVYFMWSKKWNLDEFQLLRG
jgi:hypothetical protein